MNPTALIRATLLILAVLQFALADDFKTINGKEYKNVTVTVTLSPLSEIAVVLVRFNHVARRIVNANDCIV